MPIAGSATLVGTPAVAVTYTLRIEPQPVAPATCIEVSLDRTQQFYAHLIGSDGSDVVVAARWATTSGSIDANGLLTPGQNLDSYTVTATQV